MNSRNPIRREVRQQRRQLSSTEQQAHAQALAHHLGSSRWFQNAQRIAFYLANDGEISLSPLIHHARALGKQVFLPVIDRLPSNRLWFVPCGAEQPMRLNRYGIAEPIAPKREHVAPWALDLICVPLVAFDDQGNRLGMGGGFYDRTLAYLARRRSWRKPRLVGIAHELQRVEKLACQPWDIPLCGAATETGITTFK